MTTNSLRPELEWAVAAAQDKKAGAVSVLDLHGLGSFTDAFVIATGYSQPQVQAISDEIEEQLAARGIRQHQREGYGGAEWILLDYGAFLVHVFSERARLFYDLERLWRAAKRTDFPDVLAAGVAER